jgi:hypothetical protein
MLTADSVMESSINREEWGWSLETVQTITRDAMTLARKNYKQNRQGFVKCETDSKHFDIPPDNRHMQRTIIFQAEGDRREAISIHAFFKTFT